MDMKLYKFLDGTVSDPKSRKGNCPWKIGEWKSVNQITMCKAGFHCSKYVQDALYWVNGCVLAEVEIDGDTIEKEEKICASKMRITKTYEWTSEMSLKLAIFAAEQVIKIFEEYDNEDKRPRLAIEAAKAILTSGMNARAAADAAHAAFAAAHAADATADAARATADAAARAAFAARAAADAAFAARAAAFAAHAAAFAAHAAAFAAFAAHAAAFAAFAAAHAADATAREIRQKIHNYCVLLVIGIEKKEEQP